MAAELMKCVSQANNYSRLSQQPNVPASIATTEGSTAVKDNKTNDKDYGNVSLLHLAKASTVSHFKSPTEQLGWNRNVKSRPKKWKHENTKTSSDNGFESVEM